MNVAFAEIKQDPREKFMEQWNSIRPADRQNGIGFPFECKTKWNYFLVFSWLSFFFPQVFIDLRLRNIYSIPAAVDGESYGNFPNTPENIFRLNYPNPLQIGVTHWGINWKFYSLFRPWKICSDLISIYSAIPEIIEVAILSGKLKGRGKVAYKEWKEEERQSNN